MTSRSVSICGSATPWRRMFVIPGAAVLFLIALGGCLSGGQRAFGITGRTMEPRLHPGDVVKIHPGRTPNRYDLVIYKLPGEEQRQTIGRVVGLPGEHVQVVGTSILID